LKEQIELLSNYRRGIVRGSFDFSVSRIVDHFTLPDLFQFIPKQVLRDCDELACRCSPMWKAGVAGLIRPHTRKVCCIRDGANDVSIIQAADVGVLNLPQTSWNTDSTLTYFTGIGYRFTGNCNEQKQVAGI